MSFVRKSLLKSMLSDETSNVSDRKFKLIMERINLVEKHIPDVKSRFGDYSRKIADERKTVEKICVAFNSFVANEPLEMTIKITMGDFVDILQEIVKVQNDLKTELDGIVNEFDLLTRRSKHLKGDVKNALSALDQQLARERQVKRLEALEDCEPTKQCTAQAEVIKARSEQLRTKSILEEHADIFEQERAQTVRNALLSWTTAELRYHAKALEMFTKAFQTAKMIDVQEDLNEYRCRAKSSIHSSARLLTVRDTTCPYDNDNVEFITSTPRVKI